VRSVSADYVVPPSHEKCAPTRDYAAITPAADVHHTNYSKLLGLVSGIMERSAT